MLKNNKMCINSNIFLYTNSIRNVNTSRKARKDNLTTRTNTFFDDMIKLTHFSYE